MENFWSPSINTVFILEDLALIPPLDKVFHALHASYVDRSTKMRHLTWILYAVPLSTEIYSSSHDRHGICSRLHAVFSSSLFLSPVFCWFSFVTNSSSLFLSSSLGPSPSPCLIQAPSSDLTCSDLVPPAKAPSTWPPKHSSKNTDLIIHSPVLKAFT